MSRRACEGEHLGLLKLRNPKGGAYGEERGRGRTTEGRPRGVGVESERRVRGEPPPAPPPRVRGLRGPKATPPGVCRSGAPRPERRHHLRQRCFSAPNPPFSRPIFPLAFFPGLKPPKGRGYAGKKDGKRGHVPPPATHPGPLSHATCFPMVAAPGCHSVPGRAAATSPLQPGARPPRGGGARQRRPLTCRGRGR